MTVTVFAFREVPLFARGLVRDLRVRWALEEACQPYIQRLIDEDEQSSEAYRLLQPFGQVPVYQEGNLNLFESGAIVLHIAGGCRALMPKDADRSAQVVSWVFAALNSVEPAIVNLIEIDLLHADEPWASVRRPAVEQGVTSRLSALAAVLAERDYLVDRFSAADLMMCCVLRILRHTDLVSQRPVLEDYCGRCMARPAFQKALADHLAPYAESA